MTSRESNNRALIVTALPLECEAVTHHLKGLREKEHSTGSIYKVGTFQGSRVHWEIAVVITGPGNALAGPETERAVSFLRPSVALFVGVAGGRKDVRTGDVVAADKVYGYESGKETQEGFLTRPDVIPASHRLLHRTRAESSSADWRARLTQGQQATAPRVFVKPIASGEKLVTSRESQVASLLSQSYGDALAVEMEGYGFARAMQAHPEVAHIVIRGISDLLDNKNKLSDDEDQKQAAANAAAFAFELLNKLEPPGSAVSRTALVLAGVVLVAGAVGVGMALRPMEPTPPTPVSDQKPKRQLQRLSGEVSETDGSPLPDAEVVLSWEGGHLTARTDSKGHFAFEVEAEWQASVTCKVLKEGYEPAESYATLGNPLPIQLMLERKRTKNQGSRVH